MKKRELLDLELSKAEKLAQDAAQKVSVFCQSQGLVFVGVIAMPHDEYLNLIVVGSAKDRDTKIFALQTALDEMKDLE